MRRSRAWADRIAVADGQVSLSYSELIRRSEAVAVGLARMLGSGGSLPDLAGQRVGALLPASCAHVVAQWGSWRAGALWVPLAVTHPARELAFVLDDAEPSALIVAGGLRDRLADLARERGIPLFGLDELEAAGQRDPADVGHVRVHQRVSPERPALMIYTSGTTGRPKGVVTTHGNLQAQIEALVDAWAWSGDDHILHVLPLHHVHGVVNVLCCALYAGAQCTFMEFGAAPVWERIAQGDLTLFMAVPTIYARLIRAWEEATSSDRERWSRGAQGLRVMVSGSAALPVSTLHRWREITGHTLLERYGMTEIGMGLSNPLEGERRPGTVGQPLPGVEVRLVDDAGQPVTPGEHGQIEVRGPQVFAEYWRRPEATRGAFHEGWFVTGDEAVLEDGYYRILGRRSVDILKTGGYKVSALEIEGVLREHEEIEDVAVVGVADPEWGERVCAALICAESAPDVEALRTWARERLAPYKVPRTFRVVAELPRNAMGKVVKPEVRSLFEE